MVKLPANTAFIRSCSVLVVFLVLNKLLGFVEKILIANYFGTSTDADVFIVAQGLFVSGWLFVEEILSPALIPVLSQARRDGRDRAGQVLVQRVLLLLVPAVVAFAVCSTAFQNIVGTLLYPGFDTATRAKVNMLWPFFAIGALPYYLTPVLQAYANSRKVFFPPALSAFAGRLAMIGAFVLLVRSMGLSGAGVGMIAYGMVYCVLLAVLIKIPLRIIARKAAESREYERKLAYLALPLLLGYVFSQATQWVDVRYGSMLAPGTVAALSFARKLVDVPVIVLSFCVGTVLLPYLSGFWSDGDKPRFARYVLWSVGACLVIYGAAAAVFMVGAETIVRLVYARGKFDAHSIAATATLLRFFALGLVVFSLEIIVMQACYAVRYHWYAVLTGMACACVNVGMTIVFVPRYGAVVIPIAIVSQKTMKAAVLGLLLWFKTRDRVETAIPVLGEELSSSQRTLQ